MANLKWVAPIFPVSDLDVSRSHYERLGFTTRVYEKGGYGFAVRDGVEIHLGVVEDLTIHGRASAYVRVDDADAVAELWRSAGVDVGQPVDTDWGQHECAVVDPDGNVIRFGSPMATAKDR